MGKLFIVFNWSVFKTTLRGCQVPLDTCDAKANLSLLDAQSHCCRGSCIRDS